MFKKLLIMVALLLCAASGVQAQDAKTFAVLPFILHGPSQYEYLSQGVQSMLTSRLTNPDRFTPIAATSVKKAGAVLPTDAATAQKIRQALGADYLVWGGLTIMGQGCSLDINVLSATGNTPHPMQTTLDQVIPSLEHVAGSIAGQVAGKAETSAATTQQPAAKPLNEALIVNETQADAVYSNPSLKYQDDDSTAGRWRSQTLPFASRSMVVCDGNGDGKNEIFLLNDSELFAYVVTGGQMVQMAKLELPKSRNYLRLNALDINRDGQSELIIAAAEDKDPVSMIIGFNGVFTIQDDRIPYFLGVVNLPPTFSPTLVGQRTGKVKYLDSAICQMIKSGGKYTLGPKIDLPMGGNVFNTTFLPHGDDYQVIMVDESDHLRVFSSTGSLLTVTDEAYAGSNLGVAYSEAALGLAPPNENQMPLYRVFIPLRGIATNLDRDKRFELIINRSISVAAQIFSNYRDYPQGEIQSLYWDGVGLSLQWKTARIKGTVTDYALADVDNNGKLDLVVSINSHTGLMGTSRKKCLIVAYPLDVKGEQGK